VQGFEDSSNPVFLLLEATADIGAGPFTIDGAKAQFSDAGIRADVGNTRHFVPMRYIRRMWQDQTPAPTPVEPTRATPATPERGPDAPKAP
jgi:hypothetical protein